MNPPPAQGPAPVRVVVMPDLMAKGIVDASASRVLEAWRGGRILLSVNRWMIVRYLRSFKQLGVSAEVLRWWSWWLTSPAKICHVDDEPLPLADPFQIAAELARRTKATAVIHSGIDPDLNRLQATADVPWVSVSDFFQGAGKIPG